ncbi:ThuA domain-containing protein [Catenovulum maritimum]|uniref:Trehalose utilization n=1 Tax=Catenovulum maritimum TaxID=1513271 RepID=A0A0J8GRB4_9ALTE|nr:ThuA domain-containing protein [Catenovulum maritimum]KMT65365.1 trehalose utilization [Catenovulum maritimum]
MNKIMFSGFIIISLFITGCSSTITSTQSAIPKGKIKALIIDGQNNHYEWPKTTFMMKTQLEETGLFDVSVYRTEKTWRGDKLLVSYPLNDDKKYVKVKNPETDPNFKPNFKDYDVVISNFGWKTANWPKSTQVEFVEYMKNGGGFVSIHAANNAFPDWKEYNQMIGLGGWGGRNHDSGPYVYYDNNGQLIRDSQKGNGGGHGTKHQFTLTIREANHPITQGLPKFWLHSTDELYDKLRGPAENMTILATAFASKAEKGTNRHEPILMTIEYHKGRIFHSTLGHDSRGFAGVGFITTFTRGAEWAATGKVSIPVPQDFPTIDKSISRKFN